MDRMSAILRTADGEQTLRPHQAQVLADAYSVGGSFSSIPVSGGKTHITFLLPVVQGAMRPLLITQGSLISSGKTAREFGAIAKHWHGSPVPIEMVSYQYLATVAGEDFLMRGQYDCLILDEGHHARNLDAAVVKRIDRFLVARAALGKKTAVNVMTGTIYRKSPRDIGHLLAWSLGDWAPLPWKSESDMRNWCDALAWRVKPGKRLRPGAILELARSWLPPEKLRALRDSEATCVPEHALKMARLALQRWMAETPGIVIVDESDCDKPLQINFRMLPFDPILEAAFLNFRLTDETPDGWKMVDSIARYSHEGELQAGFYNVIDPRPPAPWSIARKAMVAFVRKAIQDSERDPKPLDTEKQVFLRYPGAPEIADWKAIRDTFKPNSVPVWVSASVLHWASAWLREHSPALVWVQNLAVGEMLSRLTGVPFYSAEGRSPDGSSIVDLRPPASAILSIHALREGFNLPYWSRNAVLGWPQPADQCEQLIGRTHRTDQENTVIFDVPVLSGATLRAFGMAMSEAAQVREAIGQTQKLLKATINTSELAGYETLMQEQSRYVYKPASAV